MSVCDSHRRPRLRQAHRVRPAAAGAGRPGGHRRLPRRGAALGDPRTRIHRTKIAGRAAASRRSSPMTSQAALAVEHVEAGYGGVLALQDVSITARPGTITAVLGANGAGKTTLLATISGFVRPRQGRVALDGTDLTRRAARGDRPGRGRARAGGPGGDHRADGRGEPAGRRRCGGTGRRAGPPALADAYQRFPMLAAARQPQRGHPVRRRAADPGDRPGPDGQPDGCCCWTSRRWAWPRRSSPRSWT